MSLQLMNHTFRQVQLQWKLLLDTNTDEEEFSKLLCDHKFRSYSLSKSINFETVPISLPHTVYVFVFFLYSYFLVYFVYYRISQKYWYQFNNRSELSRSLNSFKRNFENLFSSIIDAQIHKRKINFLRIRMLSKHT